MSIKNVFKSFISKSFIVVFMSVGFSGSLFSYSNKICMVSDYHIQKNEFNLDIVYLPIPTLLEKTYITALKGYSAEVFTSYHIYSVDKIRDLNEEFQFGDNSIAKLIYYENDTKSGFNAGIYKIEKNETQNMSVNEKERIVIAFGGTGAKEAYSSIEFATLTDIIKANLKLLSNKETSGQVYQAIKFLQKAQADFENYDITVTGHSLGGALAQFASLASKNDSVYKKIKAITFNTAPMPLTDKTKGWIEDIDEPIPYGDIYHPIKWAKNNNINFRTNNDPLTAMLMFFQDYETIKETKETKYIGLLDIVKLPHKILNSAPSAINAIVYEELKKIFGTNKEILKTTIYGRIINLETKTGHSMGKLIKKAYLNWNKYDKFRSGFTDVNNKSTLYCSTLELLKNHSISYPKKDNDYKFYPNKVATRYEISIFITNSFFYHEFRKEKKKNSNLTRFQFFNKKFQGNDSTKSSQMSISEFKTILIQVFRNRILASTSEHITELLLSIFERDLTNKLANSKDTEKITRGRISNLISLVNYLDYGVYINTTKSNVSDKGSLDTYTPLPTDFLKAN